MNVSARTASRYRRRFALAAIAAALLASLAVASAQTSATKPVAAQKTAAAAVPLQAMPPDQVLQVGKKEMTKAQFVAEYEKLKRSAGPPYQAKSMTTMPLEAQAERLQASRVAADNARVQQLGSAKAKQAHPGEKKVGAPAKQALPDGPKVAAPPKIDQVIALAPITPGERFYILGGQFGSAPGKAEMIFANPPGRVTLQIVYWNPDGVALDVALPSSVHDRCDQPVTVQITRADGVQSNTVATEFGEALTMKLFDFRFSAEHCENSVVAEEAGHDGSSGNSCKDDGTTLKAYHYHGLNDLGIDTVQLPPLSNGYAYHSASKSNLCYPPVTCLVAVAGFVEGATQGMLVRIPWQYYRPNASYGALEYHFGVTVVGPECKHYLQAISDN